MTHAALGMGNLRDGGVLIVGVSERAGVWVRTGIPDDQLRSFDPDLVAAHLNSYISPHVDIDVVVVHHTDGKQYLAIYVREFALIPLVCKKNGPTDSGITEGRVYVRLPGPARTSVVTNAQQMHDLIELAAEKRARGILETGRRVGLVPGQAAPSAFDDELKGL